MSLSYFALLVNKNFEGVLSNPLLINNLSPKEKFDYWLLFVYIFYKLYNKVSFK